VTASALVVEDAEGLREMVAAVLEFDCWKVVAVGTAEEAVDAAGSQHFDVALVDVRLGGRNGLELARTLRGMDSSLPILLSTGLDPSEVEMHPAVVEIGIVGVLEKPYDPDMLCRAIAEAARSVTGRH